MFIAFAINHPRSLHSASTIVRIECFPHMQSVYSFCIFQPLDLNDSMRQRCSATVAQRFQRFLLDAKEISGKMLSVTVLSLVRKQRQLQWRWVQWDTLSVLRWKVPGLKSCFSLLSEQVYTKTMRKRIVPFVSFSNQGMSPAAINIAVSLWLPTNFHHQCLGWI